MADTPPVNEVKARHILVKTKEEADAIIKQLDGGAKFEDLANEHTDRSERQDAPAAISAISAPGQMVPEFEKAAFALEVGAYTKEPVQTPVRLARHQGRGQARPAAAGLRQVKDQIRNLVFREKYFALVNDLRKAAKVDITDPDLKKAVDAMDAAAK